MIECLKMAALALIIAIGSSTDAAIAAPINLVSNGAFETGDLTGWNVVGYGHGIYVRKADAHTGQYSLYMGNNAPYPGGIEQTINTVAGQDYNFSVF